MTQNPVPLPNLAALLRANYGTTAPRYSDLYKAVLNGAIPAFQEHGRWYVRREHLGEIAEHFALPHAHAA